MEAQRCLLCIFILQMQMPKIWNALRLSCKLLENLSDFNRLCSF